MVVEFCWTWTREWLFWQGLQAIVRVNYRPILSSERVPNIKKPAIVRQKKNSGHGLQMGARLPLGSKFNFNFNFSYKQSRVTSVESVTVWRWVYLEQATFRKMCLMVQRVPGMEILVKAVCEKESSYLTTLPLRIFSTRTWHHISSRLPRSWTLRCGTWKPKPQVPVNLISLLASYPFQI
jgi:hypothetical protein